MSEQTLNPEITADTYEEVLKLFVSQDELRAWMTTPFLVVDKAISTDGYCLVAVPKWNGQYEDRTDKVKGVYPICAEFTKEYTIQSFIDALSEVPLVDGCDEQTIITECDACDGSGLVDFEFAANRRYYYLEGDCPICDGEGECEQEVSKPNGTKIPDENYIIKVGLTCISIENIQRLIKMCELMKVQKITLTNQRSEYEKIVFKIGECELLVMPRLSNSDQFVVDIIE